MGLIENIKKKQYKYFGVKVLGFLIIIFVLDFSIGRTLNYFYFNQQSGNLFRTTHAMEITKADVLIFGSSRANHHYYPDIFEDKLKMSYYNVGRDGNFIFYHTAVLKSILSRHTPKIVILDFVKDEFKKDQSSYDRLSSLLPYYRTHPEIREIIELKSNYEKIKLISSIYPFNSLLFTIAIGNIEMNKKRKQDNKGYVALNGALNFGIKSTKPEIDLRKEDTIKINYYKSFINDCKKANVKLFVVCSPYYEVDCDEHDVEIGREIANENHVGFFDFSHDSTFCAKPALFADVKHLNDDGAKIFSEIIASKIKPYAE